MKSFPAFFAGAALTLTIQPATALDYEKDVLPIFEEKCFKCHGNGKAKSGVGLDSDRLYRMIGPRYEIIPGNAEDSLIFEVCSTEDRDERMPPPGKAPAMPAGDIETLRTWIDEGAQLSGEALVYAEKNKPSAEDQNSSALMARRPDPISGDWTNREGKTISATLLRVEGGKAVLQLASGKIYHYPIANLSDESAKKVQDFAAADSS